MENWWLATHCNGDHLLLVCEHSHLLVCKIRVSSSTVATSGSSVNIHLYRVAGNFGGVICVIFKNRLTIQHFLNNRIRN